MQGVYVQPTFAAKLNDKVSVGVGIDATYLNVELRQRVDLSTQVLGIAATDFGQLNRCPASVCGTSRSTPTSPTSS